MEAISLNRMEQTIRERRRRSSCQSPGYQGVASDEKSDRMAIAVNTIELEKSFSTSNRKEKEVKACDKALQNMIEGTYGICKRCGAVIDPARQEAVPETEYCKPCQEIQDAAAKRSGVSIIRTKYGKQQLVT